MKNEQARHAARQLLSQYLQGIISVKDMLQQWPSADDSLLNTLWNTFIENLGHEYTDEDIARLGITALDGGADEEDFERRLDAL